MVQYTSHGQEKIIPFATAPWDRTVSKFPNRFKTTPCPTGLDNTTARDKHLDLIKSYQDNPNVLYIYADGSKKNLSGFFRVGAAAVAYLCGNEIEKGQLGLGGHAEVFDTEMAALPIAAAKVELLTRDFPDVSHIESFTDNAAAVVAMTTPKPSAAQLFAIKFHNMIQALLETNANLSLGVRATVISPATTEPTN